LPTFQRTPFVWAALGQSVLYAGLWGLYGPLGQWNGQRDWRELVLWALLLGLTGVFLWGRRHVRSFKPVLLLAVVAGLICLALPPFHSTDVTGYVNRGWQQWAYHTNPYVTVVADIPGWQADPVFTNHWVTNPCPYGFFFAQLAAPMSAVGNRDTAVLLFKALNLLLLLLGGWVLHRARGPQAAYWLACHPLLLLHAVANGHNDILMGVFSLLAGWALLAGAWVWVVPALTLATLTKYAAAVSMPLAVVGLWRLKARRGLLAGLGIGLGLLALLGWPYYVDWAQFKLGAIGENATVSSNSLQAMVLDVSGSVFHMPSNTWAKPLNAVCAVGLLAVLVVGCWRVGRDRLQVLAWLVGAQALLVVGLSAKFYPWYLGMVLPMALLLPGGHWLRRGLLAVSVAQVLAFTFLGQAHIANALLLTLLPFGWAVWQSRSFYGDAEGGSVLQEPSIGK
jgi:hypothetical protein